MSKKAAGGTAVLEKGDELEIQPKQPTGKGPADLFTGDVWFDVIAKGEEPSRMRVKHRAFLPRCPHRLAFSRGRTDFARDRGARPGPGPWW